MSATRDGKMWRCQFYYKDWQGVSHKKNKRGFKTKAEAEQWERDFLQQQQRNLDINFENFVQIYYEDMEHRLRENTMRTKKFIIDLKIIPYFKKKNMNEIKASDIRAWQNALMKKGYSETYLKTVNNQLSAIFNYAVRYYDLKDNPCRKAGSIGKSHAGEKEFWTKQEFKQFLVTVENKPETKMAFLLLYWTGMRIGDLRHSHASLLISKLGAQPNLVAERLGHEKIQTTLNTYSHLYPNQSRDLADQLNDLNSGTDDEQEGDDSDAGET